MKKIMILIAVIIIPPLLLCISIVFPIKFTLKSIPYSDQRDFLIITGYYPGKGWDILGDNTGLFEEVIYRPIVIEGVNPSEVVSRKLMDTHFIVYGELMTNDYLSEQYGFSNRDNAVGLICTGWDILGDVRGNTGNGENVRFLKRYLTIYDLIWVDEYFR